MKRFWHRFLDLSVRSKIVLLLYTVILFMFVSLSVILLYVAEINAREEALATSAKFVSYSNGIIEKEQQYLYGIASYYAMAAEVQDLVNASNSGQQMEHLSEDLLDVAQSRQYVLSLGFYNKSGENIIYFSIDGSYGAINQNPDNVQRPIYDLIRGRRTFTWEYIPKGGDVYLKHDNSPKICLWYTIKDNQTWMPIGIMSVALDSRKLFPVDNVLSKSGDNVFVIDSEKGTAFGRDEIVQILSDEDIQNLISQIEPYKNSGNFHLHINGTPYYAVYGKVSSTNFVTIQLIADRKFFWNTETFFVICLTGLIFCLVSLLPILIAVSNFLTKPLEQLMHSMERFRAGDRDVQLAFKYHDEIGRIGSVFDAMVTENKQLIEKTYLLTIRTQAAELAKLQAQINPHFIYNTLNALQWTAIDNGNEEIAEMAYAIGQVFRLSLNHGNDFITVMEERELLYFYLSLQEKRFTGRLSHTLSFSDELLQVSIPKLLIQPLVENASVHGIRDANSHIDIMVAVTQETPGRLHIVVEDNGVGIPAERLVLLPDKLPETEKGVSGSHFALKNIAKRLSLYYGSSYLFHIASTEGQGTRITIDIPFEHQEIT